MMLFLFCVVLLGAWVFYNMIGFVIERLDFWLESRERDAKRRADTAYTDIEERLGVVVNLEDRRRAVR